MAPNTHHMRTPISAIVGSVCGLIACVIMTACSSSATTGRSSTTSFEPIEQRVDVVIGETLVMPVRIQGPLPSNGDVEVRLDDGRRLQADVFWMGVRPPSVDAPAWLDGLGSWVAVSPQVGSRPVSTGFWALVLDLPLDSIGQGLWLGRDRIPLTWASDVAMIGSADSQIEDPFEAWVATASAATRGNSTLNELVTPMELDPTQRWRRRLLLTGIRPATQRSSTSSDEIGDRDGDGAIEAFARQLEARWCIGLAKLWRIDRGLCHRVREALTRTIEIEPGVVVPAWRQQGSEELLRILLAPLPPQRVRSRVSHWLDDEPRATAWIIDDAGIRDAVSDGLGVAVGLANLTHTDTLSWVERPILHAGGKSPTRVLAPIDAGTTHVTFVALPPEETGLAVPIEAHVGGWTARQLALGGPLPAMPPGLSISGLFPDWTLSAWLGSPLPGIADEEARTSVLLQKLPSDQSLSSGSDSGWYAFVQCRRPAGSRQSPSERVRLYLGPSGAPTAVIEVTERGVVRDLRSESTALDNPLNTVRVFREESRWMCQIPLPKRAIERGGVLRIGVERTDWRGIRSSWPRSQMPWGTQPGRAAMDLTRWDAP